MPRYFTSALFIVTTVLSLVPSLAAAQAAPQLLVAPRAAAAASRREAPARRSRKARINAEALNAATIELHLFDDVRLIVKRNTFKRLSEDRVIWVGADESGAQAVLTMAQGVLTGNVFAENRSFEIALDADGQYSVAELDPASYPTDDPEQDAAAVLDVAVAALDGTATTSVTTATASTSATPVRIDVMIVWTPNAQEAQGGAAAMASLALSAVANANLVYANSGVHAELNLVHSGLVTYTENPTSISTDLNALKGTTDGQMDIVHSLRNTHGADIVTLIGTGYRSSGSCGIGGLMISVSTSFASNAFSIVDRTCAVGNLSYAHEVGHSQGLHHDPANASSAGSYPYAHGYQDPSGYFRTVLSYGSATRVPYLSSPTVYYSGLPTGTASQDNTRALKANLSTIAAFRSVAGTTSIPPACTFAVSPTSLSIGSGTNTKTITVTAPAGCAWSVVTSGTATWLKLSTTSGTGNGYVKVTTTANTGPVRRTSVTVAGIPVAITQRQPST